MRTKLWVDSTSNGILFMHRLGYSPVGFLTHVRDEDGDMVSCYEMPEQDALASIELITEYNALPCNDCCMIKAYIKN